MGDDKPTRGYQAPVSDHDRLILVERDVKAMQRELASGTVIMSEMAKHQTEQAIVLERINSKSSLAVWVLSIVAIAVIGSIVSSIALRSDAPLPIEIQVVYPEK